MSRARWLQETKQMRFIEAYEGYQCKRLSQEDAAMLLGVCPRTFRRYMCRHEESGLEGLLDKRLNQPSHRKARADEAMKLVDLYSGRYSGWNVKHFYGWYRRDHDGQRSYSWVKNVLQGEGVVKQGRKRGRHRKRREPAPMEGMMIHQDGSTHEWVPGCQWDLIVTMDDATNHHYSMFFVEQEGTWSSFKGVGEVIRECGLFCTLYTDRGSHYWTTPEAGGKVDKIRLTQFGRAMKRLGIQMIEAYSPEARGRSERAFGTHQGRLPQELALHGITDMAEANRYLNEVYKLAFNAEFSHPSKEGGSGFVSWIGGDLDDYLCQRYECKVGKDNCVRFERLILQIPEDSTRYHYVKATVEVIRHLDGTLSVLYGPRRLARYDPQGQMIESTQQQAAA